MVFLSLSHRRLALQHFEAFIMSWLGSPSVLIATVFCLPSQTLPPRCLFFHEEHERCRFHPLLADRTQRSSPTGKLLKPDPNSTRALPNSGKRASLLHCLSILSRKRSARAGLSAAI